VDRLYRSVVRATSDRWIPLAHAEGPEAANLTGGPLSASDLAETARNYDPRKYRAPILAARTGRTADAHDAGRGLSQAKPHVLGHVEALRFDGHTLHGRLAEKESRLTDAVRDGLSKRSVWISRANPQFGNRPYLRHLAVGYDHESQNYLPPLDDPELGIAPEMARALSEPEAGAFVRAVPDSAAPSKESPMEFDKKQIEDLVAEAVRAAGESIGAAVAKATAPLEGKITELTTKAEAATAAAAKSDEAVRALREETALASLTARLDGLVEGGKVAPKERDDQLEILRALPPEPREKALKLLEGRRSMLGEREVPAFTTGGEHGVPSGFVDGGAAAELADSWRAESKEAWVEAANAVRAETKTEPDADAILARIMREPPNFGPWARN
jgi:hypothetical protein